MRGQGLNDLPRCELERRSSHHKGIFFEVPFSHSEPIHCNEHGCFFLTRLGQLDAHLTVRDGLAEKPALGNVSRHWVYRRLNVLQNRDHH